MNLGSFYNLGIKWRCILAAVLAGMQGRVVQGAKREKVTRRLHYMRPNSYTESLLKLSIFNLSQPMQPRGDSATWGNTQCTPTDEFGSMQLSLSLTYRWGSRLAYLIAHASF